MSDPEKNYHLEFVLVMNDGELLGLVTKSYEKDQFERNLENAGSGFFLRRHGAGKCIFFFAGQGADGGSLLWDE